MERILPSLWMVLCFASVLPACANSGPAKRFDDSDLGAGNLGVGGTFSSGTSGSGTAGDGLTGIDPGMVEPPGVHRDVHRLSCYADPRYRCTGQSADSFQGAAIGTGPCVLEPLDGAMFPNNWTRPRVHVKGPPVSTNHFSHAERGQRSRRLHHEGHLDDAQGDVDRGSPRACGKKTSRSPFAQAAAGDVVNSKSLRWAQAAASSTGARPPPTRARQPRRSTGSAR